MISWMQKHRKYLVITIWVSTVAFIAAGSVGWGAYKYGGAGSDTVAKVGDEEITANELRNGTNNIYNYYNSLFGGRLTKEQAKNMNLQGMALRKLMDEALLLNYAKELGITALDDEILNEYSKINAFQKDGHFDKSTYEKILRAQGIKKRDFEDSLKKQIVISKLNKLLSLPTTPLESKAIFAAQNIADHLVVKKISVNPKEIKVDEKELKAFWEKYKDDYKSEKEFVVDIVETPIDSVKDIDEAKVKEFYNEKKYLFKDKDGKIMTYEKAKDDVLKAYKFKKGKKVALQRYIDFKKGKIKAQKELKVSVNNNPSSIPLDKLSSLKKGQYLKAIKSTDSYIALKLKDTILPKTLSFDSAKERTLAKLQVKKAKELLDKNAKRELAAKDINGKDLGFVSVNDAKKVDMLNPNSASSFLRYVFSQNSKKRGYFPSSFSALVYSIKEQKLLDDKLYGSKKDKLGKEVKSLKDSFRQRGLIEQLQKKYKSEVYIKKEERSKS